MEPTTVAAALTAFMAPEDKTDVQGHAAHAAIASVAGDEDGTDVLEYIQEWIADVNNPGVREAYEAIRTLTNAIRIGYAIRR